MGDLDAQAVPDTIQGVITSRIDRLPPSQQLTLKVASVIGRLFAYDTLEAIHPIVTARRNLRRRPRHPGTAGPDPAEQPRRPT